MSSSSSAASDYQITDASSPDLLANTVLPVVPLRYIPMADRYCPIRKRHIMVWPAALYTFVLNRVCEFIKDGVPMDKGFRMVYLKAIVEAALNISGRDVGHNQIYNHLRHWRGRCVHVMKVKKLENVRWVEKTTTIMMDGDDYFAHIKTHPKNADLIHKRIENYAQIKIIYTGHFPAAAPISPSVIHRALSHLTDHKAHANMYLATTPEDMVAWFTAFLRKYYL